MAYAYCNPCSCLQQGLRPKSLPLHPSSRWQLHQNRDSSFWTCEILFGGVAAVALPSKGRPELSKRPFRLCSQNVRCYRYWPLQRNNKESAKARTKFSKLFCQLTLFAIFAQAAPCSSGTRLVVRAQYGHPPMQSPALAPADIRRRHETLLLRNLIEVTILGETLFTIYTHYGNLI